MLRNSSPSGKTTGWLVKLAGPLVGAVVGALLAAAYGVLVAGAHLVSTGRWDRSLHFTGWSVLVGASIGLAVGALLPLVAWLSGPVQVPIIDPREPRVTPERLRGSGLVERYPVGIRL
jgi:hypothetical protein